MNLVKCSILKNLDVFFQELYANRQDQGSPRAVNLGPLVLPGGQEVLKPITKVQNNGKYPKLSHLILNIFNSLFFV
jgi:hypothetical protein